MLKQIGKNLGKMSYDLMNSRDKVKKKKPKKKKKIMKTKKKTKKKGIISERNARLKKRIKELEL